MNLTNWRTTLTAILTALTGGLAILAALPAQLGDLSTIIPEPWKPWIIKIGGGAALLLHVINGLVAKDKAVTGNGTLAEPFRTAPMIALFFSLPFFAGCATDTGNAAKDARGRATNQALIEAGKVLGQVAASSLMNAAQQEMTGGKVDLGSAASAGLWANAGTIVSSASIDNIISAYSAGALPSTASAAASVFAGSSAPAAAKTSAIAAVISTAAGAPPAP